MRAGLISLACLQLGFGGRNREGGVGGRRGWMYTFASPGRWFARRSAFFPSLEPPPVGLACFSSSPRCSRSRGRSYRSQRDSAPRSESARIQEKTLFRDEVCRFFHFCRQGYPFPPTRPSEQNTCATRVVRIFNPLPESTRAQPYYKPTVRTISARIY